MSDQLDLFAGTNDAPAEKPKKKRKQVTTSGFSQTDEERIVSFAARWECSMQRELLENDLLKFKDGVEVFPFVVAQYHALIKKVMRNMGVNAKHYEVEGYGTTHLGIVKHDGEQCLKFNHKETKESIYVEL